MNDPEKKEKEPGAGAETAPEKDGKSGQVTTDNGVKLEDSKTELARRLEGLERALDNFAGEVIVADEWGIFCKGGTEINELPGVYKLLEEAYEALKAKDLRTLEQKLLAGRAALNRVLCCKWLWRVNNHYGFVPILFTVVLTVIVYQLIFLAALRIDIQEAIKHPAFAGMIGAALKNLYWLQFQLNKGLFRPRWFASLIVAPLIGAILGWVVSLLVGSVAIVASGSTSQTDWRIVSFMGVFAGFKWQWALAWFEDSAKAVQNQLKEKAQSKTKS